MIKIENTSLTIRVTIDASSGPSSAASRSAPEAAPSAFSSQPSPQTEAQLAMEAFLAKAHKTYFDEGQDVLDKEAYYGDINWDLGQERLFQALSAKLRDTHEKLDYRPSVELYPWVDLRPDRKIRSVYSGKSYTVAEFIEMDMKVEESRQTRLREFISRAGMFSAALEEAINDLDAQLPYNCEHSVPQSWFNKKQPMRGDLHHLFACEVRCNSARGNQPYFDYEGGPAEENDCGSSGNQGFEPKGGKGAVARATLYFLLRYPGAIGDVARELQMDRLPLLLQWHREDPVSEYEFHRNQAIFQRQGNRNPLIDFPERAELIGFDVGFGQPQRHFAPASAAEFAAGPKPAFRFGQPRPLQLSQAPGTHPAAFAAHDTLGRIFAASGGATFEATADRRARSRFKKLPAPTGQEPYRLQLSDILDEQEMTRIEQAGQFVFHTVGDTGQRGHGAQAQESVAFHLEQQVKGAPDNSRPALFYHLGDVIYYQGEGDRFAEQFYDPYKFYPAPIVAIPGNHDGDNVRGDRSLAGFVENFCTVSAGEPPNPGDSTRLTMTQPNVYFTLQAPFVTIIGLYSNVTGELDRPDSQSRPQFKWLVKELRAAPQDKFLLVAVHHPPYSADNDHGSQKKIGRALDEAFRLAERLPHVVLAAHVHNYQRIHRKQTVNGVTRDIPYVVAGAGGYAGYDSLHQVFAEVAFQDGATLMASNDERPGFLTLTVSADRLKGEYFTVPVPPDHMSDTNDTESKDVFEVVF